MCRSSYLSFRYPLGACECLPCNDRQMLGRLRENAASPSKTQKFSIFILLFYSSTDGAARQITQIDSLIFVHLLDNELTTAGFIVLVVRIDGNAVTDGSRGR